MNAVIPTPTRLDLQGLVHAIAQASAEDSLTNPLNSEQWDTLSAYLQPCSLAAGQLLFNQGAADRTLYLVESGSLSVHFEDEPPSRPQPPASCGLLRRCGSPS